MFSFGENQSISKRRRATDSFCLRKTSQCIAYMCFRGWSKKDNFFQIGRMVMNV